MLWDDEKIYNSAIAALQREARLFAVRDAMMLMRDEYEQRIAELEAALDDLAEENVNLRNALNGG